MNGKSVRKSDGSAGDADYSLIGAGYGKYRQAEPLIGARIRTALGGARTILNVGAGSGSYEPVDREVTDVEPAESMRAQRPTHLAKAIWAVAEALPFPNRQFDASLSTFSVHQWQNLKKGLGEMRRVTRGPVLILTCDPEALDCFWLTQYAPKVIATEARRYPPIRLIASALGENTEVWPVAIPLNCRDGFNEAYYGRPEMILRPEARQACSAWSFLDPCEVEQFVEKLSHDLASGIWDKQFGKLRTQPELQGSLRLIVGRD